jgi:dimethylamine monooxygenase subunit A
LRRDARASRHDHRVTDYVPVDGGPWRLSMGLHRLDPGQWLELDEHRDGELRRRARLIDEVPDVVVATLPGSEAPARELLALVVDHLVARHPGLLVVDGSTIHERTTGAAVDAASAHPVVTAARLVQEDLCVLERDEQAWRLSAACVCFPSRWSLASKLGQTLGGIHGPVPGFDQALGRQAATFFDRLAVDRPVWRANWTLLDTDEPHLPVPSDRLGRWSASDVGGSLWFRVERQTLRRLPASGAIVFTIRTYVRPLAEVVATTPGFAAALRDTMRTVSPDVAAYKGWVGLLEPLDAWLASQP